jgi:type VI protein secretion system component VasF
MNPLWAAKGGMVTEAGRTRVSAQNRASGRRGAVGAPADGAPDRQVNPDKELTRSFAIGCGVLFVAFLLLTVLVYYFWSR